MYLITNTVNDKKYVGSTKHKLERRMLGHRHDATRKPDIKLYAAMNADGADAFTIEPILQMKFFDIKELLAVEDAYIAIYNSINEGYNCKYNTITHSPSNDTEYRRVYYKTKVECKTCNKLVSRKHMSQHVRTH